MGDLFMDAGQLGGQIGLAVVDELHCGVDFHAQLGDAPVEEPAENVDFRTDTGAPAPRGARSWLTWRHQTPGGLKSGKGALS
jgi:hypothetical protein